MHVRWLDDDDEAALEELLAACPPTNLFLLGAAEDPTLSANWAAAFEGQTIRAVLFALGGLLVPAGDPTAGMALGEHVAPLFRPDLLVGPRAICDAMLPAFDSPPVQRVAQRLYVCRTAAQPDSGRLELADDRDVQELARLGADMNAEDLGRTVADWKRHVGAVQARVTAGRVFVIRREGRIDFTVNVGTRHTFGCQIGGTYVRPEARGRGLATLGMADLSARLLRTWPIVTLHVREANAPAIRVYERVGFERDVPYRVATW